MTPSREGKNEKRCIEAPQDEALMQRQTYQPYLTLCAQTKLEPSGSVANGGTVARTRFDICKKVGASFLSLAPTCQNVAEKDAPTKPCGATDSRLATSAASLFLQKIGQAIRPPAVSLSGPAQSAISNIFVPESQGISGMERSHTHTIPCRSGGTFFNRRFISSRSKAVRSDSSLPSHSR